MKKIRRSDLIPALLLVYLAMMSYIGRGELFAGHYVYYFGIITITLAAIILLRITLRRRENSRKRD